MAKRELEMAYLVIDKKVWNVSKKMILSTIEVAKNKYRKENVNAIVAVEKDGMFTLQKDVFDNTDAFVEAVANWERGGYKCYYTTKKEEEK